MGVDVPTIEDSGPVQETEALPESGVELSTGRDIAMDRTATADITRDDHASEHQADLPGGAPHLAPAPDVVADVTDVPPTTALADLLTNRLGSSDETSTSAPLSAGAPSEAALFTPLSSASSEFSPFTPLAGAASGSASAQLSGAPSEPPPFTSLSGAHASDPTSTGPTSSDARHSRMHRRLAEIRGRRAAFAAARGPSDAATDPSDPSSRPRNPRPMPANLALLMHLMGPLLPDERRNAPDTPLPASDPPSDHASQPATNGTPRVPPGPLGMLIPVLMISITSRGPAARRRPAGAEMENLAGGVRSTRTNGDPGLAAATRPTVDLERPADAVPEPPDLNGERAPDDPVVRLERATNENSGEPEPPSQRSGIGAEPERPTSANVESVDVVNTLPSGGTLSRSGVPDGAGRASTPAETPGNSQRLASSWNSPDRSPGIASPLPAPVATPAFRPVFGPPLPPGWDPRRPVSPLHASTSPPHPTFGPPPPPGFGAPGSDPRARQMPSAAERQAVEELAGRCGRRHGDGDRDGGRDGDGTAWVGERSAAATGWERAGPGDEAHGVFADIVLGRWASAGG
ncbi:hypothetical protein BDK51DRAFT_49810 [Blyttiomyces helicus]|uniref:Uncharacterized protein n=1 Tax=Blyttiomyces helicus TaxID=388810 RepID=A0A4P9VVG4_9FUNG|nr:hypothetical protein BDK51DRAFT_49810 [Blyttiomyces helicus]|eukprot:RKO83634.1 hypothetical protein BDK51DRAFT_49810 [Blyttiomyces helicus]